MGIASSYWRGIGLLLLLAWAAPFGCGAQRSPQPSGAQAVGSGPTIISLEGLPALDPPLGPLDDGRVMVSPLNNWYIPVRDSQYVIRFRLAQDIAYPTILVTASDYEPIFDLSPENVEQFAKQVADEMAGQGASAGLVAAVAPILIGQRPAVAYQRRGKSGKQIVERYFLETVAAGRRYSLELRALQGTLDKFQPYAWALLSGMEFLDKQGPATPQQPQPGPEEPGQGPSSPVPEQPPGDATETPGDATARPGAPAGETPPGRPDSGAESSAPKQPPEPPRAPDTPSVIPEFEEELPPN